MSMGLGAAFREEYVSPIGVTRPAKPHRGPGRPRHPVLGDRIRIAGWSDTPFRVDAILDGIVSATKVDEHNAKSSVVHVPISMCRVRE